MLMVRLIVQQLASAASMTASERRDGNQDARGSRSIATGDLRALGFEAG